MRLKSIHNNQNKKMSTFDNNIPVATATYIYETNPHPVQQGKTNDARAAMLSTGRSSRVVLQTQDASSLNPSQTTSPKLSDQDIQSLKAQGFTMGLIRAMQYNAQVFPMRIWVVDNSGTYFVAGFHLEFACFMRTKGANRVWSALTKSSVYII